MPDTQSKAIPLSTGTDKKILIETDLSIEVPASFAVQKAKQETGLLEGEQAVSLSTNISAKLEDVKDLLKECCTAVYDSIELIPKPSKFTIEVGVKFVGEAGFPMLTKASGEASLTVSVEWEPK